MAHYDNDTRGWRTAADADDSRRMPVPVRLGLLAVVAGLVVGALYLLAVRGDALLADLSAIAALICG